MPSLPDDEITRVLHDWKQAPHNMKTKVLEDHADRLGVSVSTLYRYKREREGKSKDAPGRPKEIDRDAVKQIAEMKAKGMESGLGDRELATEIAQELAARSGIEAATDAHVSSINRILREELGFRKTKRHRRVEADFAGQVHLMDFSRSKYVQVRDRDPEKDDYLLEVSGRQLSYKDPEGAFRTWYVQYLDDYSRVAVARLFCTTGESAAVGLEFLNWVWTREEDDHPLRHVPHIVQTDYGAFRKSKEVQNAFDSLEGVDLKRASKDAQGKIERAFRTLWQRFELPFAIEHGEGYTIHLQDFNALLMDHMVREAKRPHPVHGKSREHCYRTSIVQHPPREIDADITRLAFRVYERKVDPYGCVSIEGEKWLCPESVENVDIEPGMPVRIMRNAAGEVVGRLVERHHQAPFTLEPWEQPAYDDFEAQGTGQTMQEKLREQVDVRAPLREEKPEKLNGEKVKFLSPRPDQVEIDSDFAQRAQDNPPMAPNEARVYIGRQLSDLNQNYGDVADIFEDLLGELSQPEIDAILRAYRGQFGAQRHAL